MANLTSAINIQVDSETKKAATEILNDLGLSMSTAINIFLKQIIKTDGLPFEVKNSKPSNELLESLKQGKKILKELENGKRQGYNNMTDLINSLEEE